MSSEVYSHDVMALGSNKPAWHKMGTVFPGRLSPLRVFVEGIGHRDILEVPVMLDGLALPGQKGLVALTAKGAKVPLSVVGQGYGLLKSETMYRILDGVYGGEAVVETAGTLRNGQREWVLVARESWSVVNGDKVLTYDLWVNRHDGSGCFELHRTNVRVVCQNTLKLAVASGNRVFGVKHTKNIQQSIAAALDILGYVDHLQEKQKLAINAMARTEMTANEAGKMFNVLLGIQEGVKSSTRVENQAEELNRLFKHGTGNMGKTRWDALNSVTEYVDHGRSSRVTEGRDESEVRFESVLMGSGDALKARAFDLLSV